MGNKREALVVSLVASALNSFENFQFQSPWKLKKLSCWPNMETMVYKLLGNSGRKGRIKRTGSRPCITGMKSRIGDLGPLLCCRDSITLNNITSNSSNAR